MSQRNPFNASRPGNLFTGYERLRRRVIDGLENGKSYAITGGRRCGKTSILLQLAEDLSAASDRQTKFLPRFVDLHGSVPHTPAEFFGLLSRLMVQDSAVAAWAPAVDDRQAYQDFLSWAKGAVGQLTEAHGSNWVCVVLMDELEVAAHYLPEECFGNLRSFLMVEPAGSNIRVVASGVGALARLITRGSPLNNLEQESLGALPIADAKALMARGFGDVPLGEEAVERLLDLSGGHPWILQGLLGTLWEERAAMAPDVIESAVAHFVRNRDDVFVSWIKSFGEAGITAFGLAAGVAAAGVPSAAIRVKLPRDATLDGVLRILAYHGVIRETAQGVVLANGTIFRDWFNQNVGFISEDIASDQGQTNLAAQEVVAKCHRVFVVFGRDRKLYSAVLKFLRVLKLSPVEWSEALEGTGNPSATIREILDQAFKIAQAVVVLLTPDDEAKLRDVFHSSHEPEHEKTLTLQPRPNVIFEAGFAMARFPKATLLVRFDKATRLFSDIGGVFLLDLSNEIVDRQGFIQRLRMCGLEVDDSSPDWQTKERGGDFTPA